jgi:hypothetical protein
MPDGPRRLPLIALGALVALIALILAGIYIYRGVGTLTVSASTPVILFTDAGNSNQIDGLTWDGQRAGNAYSGESDQSFRSFRSPRRRRPH